MDLVKNLSVVVAITGSLAVTTSAVPAFALSLEYERDIGRPATFQNGDFPGVPGTLAVPQGIGVQDSTGHIFISNGRRIDRVDIFDSQGNYLRAIGSTGQGPGQFDEPADLRFNPLNGNLYVGDVFNSRINVFEPNGNFVKSFGRFNGQLEGRAFFGPGGMDFDATGNLYVSDFSGDFVRVFNPNGEEIRKIGSPGTTLGQFSGPGGLIISENTGRIYVNDQYNGRVQVLDAQANSLFAFGTTGNAPGQFKEPIGIDVDEFENIYVADSQNSRVQVFDKDGKLLTVFGEPTRNSAGEIVPPPVPISLGGTTPYGNPLDLTPAKFNWTGGLHYDKDKVYVGDFFQGRIQVLKVDRESVPEPASVFGLMLLGIGFTAGNLRKKHQQLAK